ncbi:MAG: hypothetical protein E8D49_08440 [Nitrospira sp.]|nr:MAG: hypothetical protein E8D49_08440 [Nitrospira sp.]
MSKIQNESRQDKLRRLIKEWLKSGQDALPDVIKNLMDEGAETLIPKPSLIERYKSGSLRLHLHVLAHCLIGGVWKIGHLCFVAQYAIGRAQGGHISAGSDTVGSCCCDTDINGVHHCSSEMHVPMLVYVGERIQNPQGMICDIPTMVRLQSMNDCLRLNGHPANARVARFIVARGVIENWETGFIGGFPPIQSDQLKSNTIETTSHIVEAITEQHRQTDGRVWTNVHDEDVMLSAVFDDELVRLDIKVSDHLIIECAEMLLSPDQFLVDSVERACRHKGGIV